MPAVGIDRLPGGHGEPRLGEGEDGGREGSHSSTILGVVSMLEERGRSNYLASVRNVLDSRRISPGLSCFVPLAHTRAH
jgi:hypothetical protein